MGGDPSQYYRSVGNRFRNNLVVEPHSFSISIRKMAQHDSTALEADNRFLNNTFLIMAGAPKVVFGDRSFDNPKLFEKGYKNATGNVFVTSLRMLRASDRDRIHEALKKVLNSLRLVKGGPSIAVDKVKLKDIWALGSKTTAMGYWVEGDDKNYLLLDLAAPDTFRLSASAKTAEVWDFPVLKGAVKKPFEKKGNLLTGSVDGPFALVTGLDDGTRPIRLRVKTGETRPGK
jgi:hypothetical protein